MWFMLLNLAFAGPADELAGAWRFDKARSDPTETALQGIAPMGPPPGAGRGGGPPGGGMGGGPPGGGMGGPPPGDLADGGPSAPPQDGRMMLMGLLHEGTSGLRIAATEDGLTVCWGLMPPLTLVVDGPTVKVKTPGGVLRVHAETTAYGVALVRKVSGARLSETLFREGDALIVGVEASAQRGQSVYLRRVYVRDGSQMILAPPI